MRTPATVGRAVDIAARMVYANLANSGVDVGAQSRAQMYGRMSATVHLAGRTRGCTAQLLTRALQ